MLMKGLHIHKLTLRFCQWTLQVGVAVLLGTGAAASGAESVLPPGSSHTAARNVYSTCKSCQNCHEAAYDQHVQSMHSRSFSNPVFQAQYTKDILPLALQGGEMFHEARSCVSCHAPVAYKQSGARLVLPDPLTASQSSVTCDFCHTIGGFKGSEPGNANYLTQPGPTKLGPFLTRTDWHHQYSELQTRSEFCAICHSVRNRLGLDIKSTYAEWKESRHAKEGIQCQDCHMNVNGFLTAGRPVHASGVAAEMSLGTAPHREKLYTHRFQGARSHSQIEGAISLQFDTEGLAPVPGQKLRVVLKVDNSRTGHKMPSGSVELRFMWLDVYAEAGGERVPLVPVQGAGDSLFDLSGAHEELDLGTGVPAGRRIYRTLLSDSEGGATLAFYDAASILFDNRLNASEVREESYQFTVPGTAAAPVKLVAAMYYQAYPDSFATRLGLAKSEPIRVAGAAAELSAAVPNVP